jgi:hypothetical protein
MSTTNFQGTESTLNSGTYNPSGGGVYAVTVTGNFTASVSVDDVTGLISGGSFQATDTLTFSPLNDYATAHPISPLTKNGTASITGTNNIDNFSFNYTANLLHGMSTGGVDPGLTAFDASGFLNDSGGHFVSLLVAYQGTRQSLLPVVSLSNSLAHVNEDAGTASFTVTRSFVQPGDTGSDVFVSTEEFSARDNINFQALDNHEVHFGPGDTSATFTVPILDDDQSDAEAPINVDFLLQLSNPQNATIGNDREDVVIVENDLPIQITGYPPLPASTTVIPPGTTNYRVPDAGSGQKFYTAAGSNTNITIVAGAGNQVIYTEPMTGGGTNTVDGGSGLDQFIAGSGNNTYIGGTGITFVDYATEMNVASTGATITRNANGTTTVHYSGGTDTLTNVKVLHFTDKTVALRTPTADEFAPSNSSDTLWRNASTGAWGWSDVHNSLAWHDLGGSATAYNVVGPATSTAMARRMCCGGTIRAAPGAGRTFTTASPGTISAAP